MENKVQFGLKNAHYAVATENVDGSYTYATPVKMKGATALTLTPKGEPTEFYADNVLYYSDTHNNGYDAILTLATITEAFRKDVLGEILDATDLVLTETNTVKPKKIALMFEFDGDVKATRHVLFNCSVSRPNASGSTKTTNSEPNTVELTLIAAPRPIDGVVKVSTTSQTPSTVYDAWYTAVYE